MTVEPITLIWSIAAILGGPPNDDCASAQPVTGIGIFSFDTSEATTDGPGEFSCFSDDDGLGIITQDVWFCWTPPPGSFSIVIDTCAGTTVDTRIAVYDGCDCSPNNMRLLKCGDDECTTQSRVGTGFGEDSPLLVRIGSHPGVAGGTGTWAVRDDRNSRALCSQPEGNCQRRGMFDAILSDGTTSVVADDFTAETDGSVFEVCWWGAYLDDTGDCVAPDGDAFEVRYYLDDGGVPGALVGGPFLQSDGTLVVRKATPTDELLAGVNREYAFQATHESVPVTAGGCYWIEIVNATTGACKWHWEVAAESNRGLLAQDGANGTLPDGFMSSDLRAGDMAFCLDVPLGSTLTCRPPPPENDSCRDSIPIEEGLTPFDTTNATTGRYSSAITNYCYEVRDLCCDMEGAARSSRDIWFDYTPPCDGLLRVDVCDSLFDTKIGIRQDNCSFDTFTRWIACSDDDCGDPLEPLQSQLELEVIGGEFYRLQIGGHESAELDMRGPSDCFEQHPLEAGGGCDDPVCADAVCNDFPENTSCCSTEWDARCVGYAIDRCVGRGGPGTIDLQLVAPPPLNETLRSYVDFIACFSGQCDNGFCDPPIYPEPCCLIHDFDADGDVDQSDFAAFRDALEGP